MSLNDNFSYIGHVAKCHGLNGQFSIKIDFPQHLCAVFKELKSIYIGSKSNKSIVIDSFINNSIFLKTRINTIKSREDAKSILQKKVYIKNGEHKKIDDTINKINELLHFKIIDKNEGEVGKINKVDFNRVQPMLFVLTNSNNLIQIPFVNEFIVNINKKNKLINVDLPEGLLEICKK